MRRFTPQEFGFLAWLNLCNVIIFLSAFLCLIIINSLFNRPRWVIAAASIITAFGIVTIIVGGKALFGGTQARAAAGNIVPFVLWFNFVAGFAYVIAGFGLLLWRRWAAQLSAAIAAATIAVFIVFGTHIFSWWHVRTPNGRCNDYS